FVPIYLHYIGIESYGLIGIFSSIQAFIILLDFGLSPTLNRELARLSALTDRTQEMHDIKRTLEIPN
ncbi:MAG: polysaccharide biosynthesis protein, partial [Acidobacteriota bacterium]|nr:polysaccharide biosynthesis protein [Acidobacteriota bacterium]